MCIQSTSLLFPLWGKIQKGASLWGKDVRRTERGTLVIGSTIFNRRVPDEYIEGDIRIPGL